MKSTHFATLALSFPQTGVGIITLNRPEAANALNTQMGEELAAALTELAQNPDCRVLLLTGQGRNFCAGADLKERKGMTEDAWHRQHAAFESALHGLLALPIPVIAAVNGAAYGGGCELALACDFIYASHSATFALPEATLGIMPGLGGTQLLARAVGERRAKEIVLSGRPFSSEQAHDWGMVNHVSYNDLVLTDALDIAGAIARNAPLAVRAIKRAIHEGLQQNLENGLASELSLYGELIKTKDRQEGINAFNEKRPPSFTGS